MPRSKRRSYSITSSARPISVLGTLRPSALAVFKLMYSSTLVACCTGRSAGLSPLRALPAKAERLRVAELIVRRLNGFVENLVEAVRITNELRLPAFRFSQLDPYTWPRSRWSSRRGVDYAWSQY